MAILGRPALGHEATSPVEVGLARPVAQRSCRGLWPDACQPHTLCLLSRRVVWVPHLGCACSILLELSRLRCVLGIVSDGARRLLLRSAPGAR